MRIVCFHLNQVGDLAFALPALKSIRDGFPDAIITSVVRPGVLDLLASTGLVDDVLSRNGSLNLDKLALIKRLLSARYDLAVLFSQSAECAFLAYMSGARRRVGFVNTSCGRLLTEQVGFAHPPSTENNLRLVSAVGCEITSSNYVGLLTPTGEQIAAGDEVLSNYGIASSDRIVAFAPGTSGRRSVKEWTDDGYAEVARLLTARGFRVAIIGSEPAAGITGRCDSIVDLSGKTNLVEAAAILHRSRTLIAVDSGMLHLAAALGKRVVGLYGPSNWNITGPQGDGHVLVTSGESCSPCMQTVCKLERKCMTNIDAAQVIEAVDSILAG